MLRSKVSDKRQRSHNLLTAKVSMLLKRQGQFRRQGKNTSSPGYENMHRTESAQVRLQDFFKL